MFGHIICCVHKTAKDYWLEAVFNQSLHFAGRSLKLVIGFAGKGFRPTRKSKEFSAGAIRFIFVVRARAEIDGNCIVYIVLVKDRAATYFINIIIRR